MFSVDTETMAIIMHQGDTGSFKVRAERATGEAWTEDDRMLMTVISPANEIVMQRIYRLDDQYELGDGVVLIEFHNDDTDTWDQGMYQTELRFNIAPIWDGEAPTARCVDALTAGVRMIEGGVVRTTIHSSLQIDNAYGDI